MLGWYRPALLTALREGYSRRDLLADLGAGALVGVVAIPLSMALGIAAGLTPEAGLWTAIIGGFLISLLGGSRFQIGGPAGAFVGLCALGVNQFGAGGLALATLMAGGLILLLGICRLGAVISYIPLPVILGFTTGIALILASTQLAPALGIPDPVQPLDALHARIAHLIAHAGEARWQPAAICCLVVAVIVLCRRYAPRLPGALCALVLTSALVAVLHWESSGTVTTIATSRFHGIPSGVPLLSTDHLATRHFADLSGVFSYLGELSGLALALGLLGAIESLLSAVVADGMTGRRHDANSELVGQGVTNMLLPFFGCLPASGVIARTATSIRSGARTPIAGLIHALTVLVIVLLCAPLVGHVPLAALAGVLLMVCWTMAELRHWPHILRSGGSDALLLPLVFVLTATVGLTEAILVGVVLGLCFFAKRLADHMPIERLAADDLPSPVPAGIEIYEIRGPFFFAAATILRDLEGHLAPGSHALILRLREVPFIDATAAGALRELARSCRARGMRLILVEATPGAQRDLIRHGLARDLPPCDADLRTALATAQVER